MVHVQLEFFAKELCTVVTPGPTKTAYVTPYSPYFGLFETRPSGRDADSSQLQQNLDIILDI